MNNQKELIEPHVAAIMEILGLDLNDPSLKETPKRVAKMYVDEIFAGLKKGNYPRMMAVPNDVVGYEQMLIERDVKVHSVCEHHLVPIVGVAHVAYFPKKNGKVVGLSKLNRLVDYYSRRPQVQERLTEQIHEALVKELETTDVAVILDARHFCVILRGVQDMNSSTVTSKLSGVFLKPEVRQELMDLLHNRPTW